MDNFLFTLTFFFTIRKILASVFQGLCLTPGRRLLATIEKLNMCTPFSNPPDAALKALLELVQRQKWNNSLEDLAVSIGALRDDEQDFKTNTNLVLKAILDRLANSGEWKLMEMANRHELKYIVDTSLSCSHRHTAARWKPRSDAIEWSLPFVCSANPMNSRITEEDLQQLIGRLNRETTEVDCKVCHEHVELTVFLTIPHACDPDFLTLVCNNPVSIQNRNVRLKFSKSLYSVKAVTHWHEERKVAAVSREKNDGSWWWHGVVKSQALEYKYTEDQLHTFSHFKDVVVLFAVRSGSAHKEEQAHEKGEMSQSSAESNSSDLIHNTQKGQESKTGSDGGMSSITNEVEGDQHGKDKSAEEGNSSDDEATKAMIERAKIVSRQVNWNCLSQADMVKRGLEAAADLDLNCIAPESFIPMDGRCLWSCIARSRNPSLTGDDLAREADELRTQGVGLAIQMIDTLSGEDLAIVQAVVAEERREALSREQIVEELAKYMKSSAYSGKMGDLLFQIASSFLHQGLIIIQLRKDGEYCLPVFPDFGIFKGHEEVPYPAILVRQEDHYEELPIPKRAMQQAAGRYKELKQSSRMVTWTEANGRERMRIAPIATSTPLKDFPTERQSPSENEGRPEAPRTSLFEELDKDLQSSLSQLTGAQQEQVEKSIQKIPFFFIKIPSPTPFPLRSLWNSKYIILFSYFL